MSRSQRPVSILSGGPLAIGLAASMAVFLLVVITATIITFIMPETYISSTRIHVQGAARNDASGSPGPNELLFPRSECEIMLSEVVLSPVIEALDLNNRWGKTFADGGRLRKVETLQILKARTEVRLIPETSIIEVRSYSDSPPEAAEIANFISEAYLKHTV